MPRSAEKIQKPPESAGSVEVNAELDKTDTGRIFFEHAEEAGEKTTTEVEEAQTRAKRIEAAADGALTVSERKTNLRLVKAGEDLKADETAEVAPLTDEARTLLDINPAGARDTDDRKTVVDLPVFEEGPDARKTVLDMSLVGEGLDTRKTVVDMPVADAGLETRKTVVDMPVADEGLDTRKTVVDMPVAAERSDAGKALPFMRAAELAPGVKPPEKGPRTEKTVEKEMLQAGMELAKFQAQFERKRVKGMDADEAQAKMEALKAKFEGKRLEYVGENFERMVKSQEYEIKMRKNFLEEKRHWSTKALKSVATFYKKSGDLNLERLGWKPQNRALKIVAKAASVRTAVSLGLLTTTWIAGAGAAVSLGAIATRRAMSGMGAAFGTYGVLRRVEEARLEAGFSPLQLETMDKEQVVIRLEQIEANALAGGKSPSKNKAYGALQKRFVEIATAERTFKKSAGTWNDQEMKRQMGETDFEVEAERSDIKRKNVVRGVVAGGVGVVVGGGFLARAFGNVTHWTAEKLGIIKSTASQAAHEAVPTAAVAHEAAATHAENAGAVTEHAPATNATEAATAAETAKVAEVQPNGEIKIMAPEAHEAAPTAAAEKASEIVKGDGYSRVIKRDLLVDPEKYGYDAAHDGSVEKWAAKTTSKIVHDNGLAGGAREMRLRFDAAHPGHVSLEMHDGHITVEKTGVREYVFEHQAPVAPVAEVHAPAASVDVNAPSVETANMKVSGIMEAVGEHANGVTGAPVRELGSVVHEFKAPVNPADVRDVAYYENAKLGTGSLKQAELVNKIFKDRTSQLHALKGAYEEAHRTGQTGLEQRLFTDYNAVAHEANGKIGKVFADLRPIEGGSVEPPAFADHGAPLAPSAEHAAKAGSEAAKLKVVPGEAGAPGTEGVVKFKDGGMVQFLRDAKGKLVGADVVQDLTDSEIKKVRAMLGDDWLKKASEHAGKKLSEGRVMAEMQHFYAEKKAFVALQNTDNVTHEQAQYLADKIAKTSKLLAKKYGDIFAEGAKATKEKIAA